jgi:AcrR family transcriptional regulator
MGKVTAKVEAGPEQGRKAAYFARNRAALILATQELLGKKGWVATIEEVASNAEVSVSTIYQHFDSKEELFRACVLEAWVTFETWAVEGAAGAKDPLEQLVVPMRLFFRATTSHPMFARMIEKNPNHIGPVLPDLAKNLVLEMHQLVKAKVIDVDHLDIRIANLKAVLLQIFLRQLNEKNSKPVEADLALALALPMIGISPAKATAITTTSLPIR